MSFILMAHLKNVLGDQTWVEAWQGYVNADGASEKVAAPVAPHDGSNASLGVTMKQT